MSTNRWPLDQQRRINFSGEIEKKVLPDVPRQFPSNSSSTSKTWFALLFMISAFFLSIFFMSFRYSLWSCTAEESEN